MEETVLSVEIHFEEMEHRNARLKGEQNDFVTCIDGVPIGFVTWDPRNIPDYVEI